MNNQTLDPKGGDIIQNKIILPMREFKLLVLMNSPLGNLFIQMEESFMSIQMKFWIVMLIYTITTWCFALFIIWITYN